MCDLTCGMSSRLDLDLKSFTGTAFRQKIFYRNGGPDRSGLLSPLDLTKDIAGLLRDLDQNQILYTVEIRVE